VKLYQHKGFVITMTEQRRAVCVE